LPEKQRRLTWLKRDPLFWSTQAYCLQTTFFIIFGRIFDPDSDAHSINGVLKATRDNSQLFSRSALAERKGDAAVQSAIARELIESAWEPSADDLKRVATPLNGCEKRFENVYQPIRSKVFAHGTLKDPDRAELISNAQIPEIIAMLTALQKV
jgi:AbiU2